MNPDDVTWTIDNFADWLPAELMVDELNGDAGDTVAWIVEYEDGDDDRLIVFWEADGRVDIRNEVLDNRYGHDNWEVKYP